MDLIARPSKPRTRELRMLAKIGVAAILAWWVCELLGAERPAFAAIVPLVALRADDPYGALGVSVFRIAGTVIGIVLGIAALAVDPDAPLWLVSVTVALALAVGLVVRSPSEPINPVAAVTALVVLFVGKGRVDSYAWVRIWETLVGAGVTVVVAAAVWPPDPIGGLRDLLDGVREDVSADLRDVARFPGLPVTEAAMLLDDRIRRSMDTGDVTRTLDRASSGLRWNLREHGRRGELVDLTPPIRQLMAMSRYSRSLLWTLMNQPDGDRIRRWAPDAMDPFEEALARTDDAAGAIADGQDAFARIEEADRAFDRFAHDAAGSGHRDQLAEEIRAGGLAMLRVLRSSTSERLHALAQERYGQR